MSIKLLDIVECRLSSSNCLLVPCQGKNPDGSPHCCGMIRIPFTPTLESAPLTPNAQRYWDRISGETLADITLSPSIDAGQCGHFHIVDGEIRPC